MKFNFGTFWSVAYITLLLIVIAMLIGLCCTAVVGLAIAWPKQFWVSVGALMVFFTPATICAIRDGSATSGMENQNGR